MRTHVARCQLCGWEREVRPVSLHERRVFRTDFSIWRMCDECRAALALEAYVVKGQDGGLSAGLFLLSW